MQLKWANKPIEPRKVKSLAEIQAEEEQERLSKVSDASRIIIRRPCLNKS